MHDQLNLTSQPPRLTPFSPATRPQFDPELSAMLDKLEALFISRGVPRPERADAQAQCRAITEHVAASLYVDHDRLLSRDRHQHISFVRQVCVYLARKITAGSWHCLADYFNRNHATLIHACNVIQRRIDDPIHGPAFSKLIAKLEEQITTTASTTARAAA